MNEVFSKNGFVIIRNLISSEESKKLRLEINKVFKLPNTELTQRQIKARLTRILMELQNLMHFGK